MATFTAKVLADGQLANTKSTLYTVPAATRTYIKQLRLFSTGANQTIIIQLNTSGTSRKYCQFFLTTNESATVFDEPIMLVDGDLVEGHSTSATTVDYVLTGVEET